uniref:Uncharacterized protein n=1 Tax=Octopus bimaculoides TaxID=37653 RepID=A0A0L8HD47_OCTBM
MFILSPPSLCDFICSFSSPILSPSPVCLLLLLLPYHRSLSSPPRVIIYILPASPCLSSFFLYPSFSLPLAVSSPPSPPSTVGARQQHNKMAGLAQPKSESKLPLEIRTKSVEHTLVPLVAQVSTR